MTDNSVQIVSILPTKVWIESGIMGERAVMRQHEGDEPFEYCVFNYNYAHTSNGQTHADAEAMARAIGATGPIEHRHRELPPPTDEQAEFLRLLDEANTEHEAKTEALTAENARLRAEIASTNERWEKSHQTALAIQDERDRLQEELEGAREDAGRYRYLRDISRRDCLLLEGPEAGVWCDCENEHGELILLTEDDLDAAIDAAMRKPG